MDIGSRVSLPGHQNGRIISLTTLFGQHYADVFIEPDGPVQRFSLQSLRLLADPFAELVSAPSNGGISNPAALFTARLSAHRLQALITQSGVLSAANFRVTPLPHQVLAVDFVLGQFRPRAVIADEVGLGKTIEAAMIVEELKLRRQVQRVLVITPAGLTDQWKDELQQKFGETFVIYDRSLLAALREIHGQEANLWRQHDQVITSLDFVKPQRVGLDLSPRERQRREENNRRIFQDLVDANWDVVIFDEAHKLSKHRDGSETARYKVGEALAQAAPVFLLLSATPHQGDAGRFLHLLNLVDPYAFNQVSDLQPENVMEVVWRTRKRAAVDGQGKRLFTHRIVDVYPVDRSGPEHTLERQLYDEVTSYVSENYDRAMGRGDRAFGFLMILFQRMLTSSTQAIHDALVKRQEKLQALQRRVAGDSAGPNGNGSGNNHTSNGELRLDEEAAADEDAQRLYDDLIGSSGVIDAAELARELDILGYLLDLARRALRNTDAKAAALLNIIDEVTRREGPNTKFLIFTEFVATQKALRSMLESLGYRVEVIHGGQTMEERIVARQAFAGESQFLVSTDAGGEGINLQFCHVMVNFDLPWNPMKLEQRIGRLDRIGQVHNVLVLNLLVDGTVEKRVREVLENKLKLIREQYGDDKLADILSTLQDEFQFDRLYMDAVLRRQAEATELEGLAQQIYQRARQILEQDDLLLPQAQARVEEYRQKLVEISQDRLRTLLEGYLLARGERLQEYSRRPGVFFFDLPDRDGLKTHYAEVVFDRERAVADDGLDYLHLNHPIIQRLLGELASEDGMGIGAAAVIRLRKDVSRAAASLGALHAVFNNLDRPGLLAVYRLRMTNHVDLDRSELIPVYIDTSGQDHPRLAQALLDLTPEQAETAYIAPGAIPLNDLRDQAGRLAEKKAADIFSEAQVENAQRLEAERRKVERYYRQQESAVAQIAIDNIRLAKQRELLDRRRADMVLLDRRITLIPQLDLVAAALIVPSA